MLNLVSLQRKSLSEALHSHFKSPKFFLKKRKTPIRKRMAGQPLFRNLNKELKIYIITPTDGRIKLKIRTCLTGLPNEAVKKDRPRPKKILFADVLYQSMLSEIIDNMSPFAKKEQKKERERNGLTVPTI